MNIHRIKISKCGKLATSLTGETLKLTIPLNMYSEYEADAERITATDQITGTIGTFVYMFAPIVYIKGNGQQSFNH